MRTFTFKKDTEFTTRSDAGGFQIDSLYDEGGKDITDKIDVGIFH